MIKINILHFSSRGGCVKSSYVWYSLFLVSFVLGRYSGRGMNVDMGTTILHVVANAVLGRAKVEGGL